eukprot:m.413046 g.413046  ORF g.413046 m.413046 type:complete len:55 (+) comp29007_c0_seq1:162-326(+)
MYSCVFDLALIVRNCDMSNFEVFGSGLGDEDPDVWFQHASTSVQIPTGSIFPAR